MIETIVYAIEEMIIAAQGGDWGYGALAELLGSEPLAEQVINAIARVFG